MENSPGTASHRPGKRLEHLAGDTAQTPMKAEYGASDADTGPRWTAHLRIPASAFHVHGDERCEIGEVAIIGSPNPRCADS